MFFKHERMSNNTNSENQNQVIYSFCSNFYLFQCCFFSLSLMEFREWLTKKKRLVQIS